MKISRVTAGHLLALVTIIIWGTTFVSTKVLLETFTPIEILFIRFFIGYVVLLIIKPKILKFKSLKEEITYIGAGLSGVTLYFLFENIALTYTFASNVGIIISVAPVFTALIAYFALKEEKLHLRFFIGFLVAIIGIAIVTFNGSYVLKLNPLGDMLATLAALVWAIYSIFMKKISTFGYNTIQSTRKVFFYGLILIIPFIPFFHFDLNINQFSSYKNILNILYLGLGASAACFVIWNWVIGVLGAIKTSAYIYLVPVVTIIFSAIILDERITVMSITGCAFASVGLYISENRSKLKNKDF